MTPKARESKGAEVALEPGSIRAVFNKMRVSAGRASSAPPGVPSGPTPILMPTPPEEDGSFNGLFSPVIDSSEDSEVAKVVLLMPQTVRDRSASWTIRDLN